MSRQNEAVLTGFFLFGFQCSMTETVPEFSDVPDVVKRISYIAEHMSPPGRIEKALSFRPGPGYICLASGIKSGTTWTQQILHGLRSGGDMSFDEIDSVIYNMEYSADIIALHKKQPYQPQMYKTHFTCEQCPKGFAKYIIITRDPRDAALSLYWHCCNWLFEESELSIHDFVTYFVTSKVPDEYSAMNAMQLKHQASWYPHRKDDNVLWLHYEDLKQDLTQCIKLISDFLEIGVGDEKLLKLVEQQASFEFMKKHSTKFDEHPLKLERNEAMGLPKMAGLTKDSSGRVRNGNLDEGKNLLPKEVIAGIDARWRSLFAPICEYSCYEEMRAGINKELGRTFKDN